MPARPLRPCRTPGCRALSTTSHCLAHDRHVHYDATRGTAAERGYDREWQLVRSEYLRDHPTCGCGRSATEVHHLTPVRDAPYLRLVKSNLYAVCHRCHMRVEAERRRV